MMRVLPILGHYVMQRGHVTKSEFVTSVAAMAGYMRRNMEY